MFRHLTIALFFLATAGMSSRAIAADSDPKFETHVRWILKQHCFHCHGEERHPEGGLDLRLVRFMKQGGDSGESISPGAPDESLLLQRIVDGEMPPDEGKLLTETEIDVIRNWIASAQHRSTRTRITRIGTSHHTRRISALVVPADHPAECSKRPKLRRGRQPH